MKRGVFITGTDTGVGKTIAACALLNALASRGVRAAPMKPIAAGVVKGSGRLANEDSLALLEASGLDFSWLEVVTPVLLREAIAPHIAAAREGKVFSFDPILAAFERLEASSDFLVVEGVGGFRVPLDERRDTVDLARVIGLPVVMVVGLRLGCLNHALLTAQAIDAAGLAFAGWIANAVDPAMAAPDENVAALEARLRAPLLGRLPHMRPPDARVLASRLDIGSLIPSRSPTEA
ncbi:MAG: dethiobiotin synthase [Usitatibacter sp.]